MSNESPFKINVQGGKVWIEPAVIPWGEGGWLEGFTPAEARDLATKIIAAADRVDG